MKIEHNRLMNTTTIVSCQKDKYPEMSSVSGTIDMIRRQRSSVIDGYTNYIYKDLLSLARRIFTCKGDNLNVT